jgi:hypothetical protein
MKSERELRELAEKYGVKTTKRQWFDCREEGGGMVTRFIDLPRPRYELIEELEEVGAL